METIQTVVVVIGIYLALQRVTAGLKTSIDNLSTEVRGLLTKVTRIEATYVTEEECAARRASGSCQKG